MGETPGGGQFEWEVLARAQAGINSQDNVERQSRFFVEDRDLLCFVVFYQFEVVLLQTGNGGAMLVRHGDEHVHQLDVNLESGIGLLSSGDKAQDQHKASSCSSFHQGR